ncbi:hypothetical protein MUO93_02500 [Candidatus Bathyarchaeota archaeon]|jgi:hypothetical protein|nr:hypothetical protein [Candidatus Bathyarchaeota archaeon]
MKALTREAYEGRLVKSISGLTTFSGQYTRKLLPDEYKQENMVREIAKPSFATEQKPKRKSKWHTTEE